MAVSKSVEPATQPDLMEVEMNAEVVVRQDLTTDGQGVASA